MLSNHYFPRIVLLAGMLAAGMAVGSLEGQSSTQPDNTRVNKQDRAPDAVTADQQKNNRSDRETTREIRKAVMADKSLSSYGHNVKIVTQGGAVTVKGPVRSEEERKAIVSEAEQVAGNDKVTDQLTVKSAR